MKPLVTTGCMPYTGQVDAIKRFLARKFTKPRDIRVELRVYPEQRAAYDRAALLEGDSDMSAWARRKLDAAARSTIEAAR